MKPRLDRALGAAGERPAPEGDATLPAPYTGHPADRDPPRLGHRLHVTVIQPPRGWVLPDAGELWRFRQLLYFLTWRTVKVRYKQTVIGAAWAILQPVVAMVVFTVIFGDLLGVPSDALPYPVFAYAGLLPWTYFATSVAGATASLVYDAQVITKVHFPRLLVPLSAVCAPALDFAIAFVVLLGLMAAFGIEITPAILLLPLFVLLAFLSAFGFGVWLAALNVRYRDVGFAVPFLLQTWLFVTPVVYPSSVLPEPWRVVSGLNPMTGVLDGFRWALLGAPVAGSTLLASVLVSLLVLVSGLYYFGRMEAQFADVV